MIKRRIGSLISKSVLLADIMPVILFHFKKLSKENIIFTYCILSEGTGGSEDLFKITILIDLVQLSSWQTSLADLTLTYNFLQVDTEMTIYK